jgi:hypothetical protein
MKRVLLLLTFLLSGCAAGSLAGHGVAARSATDGGAPPVLQGAVPFALLLVVGLLISRGFKSE